MIVTLQIRLPEGDDEAVDRLVGELESKYSTGPRGDLAF